MSANTKKRCHCTPTCRSVIGLRQHRRHYRKADPGAIQPSSDDDSQIGNSQPMDVDPPADQVISHNLSANEATFPPDDHDQMLPSKSDNSSRDMGDDSDLDDSCSDNLSEVFVDLDEDLEDPFADYDVDYDEDVDTYEALTADELVQDLDRILDSENEAELHEFRMFSY